MDLKLVFALVGVALVCHTMAYQLEEEKARALEEGILKQFANLQSRSQEHEKRADPSARVCYQRTNGRDYRGTKSTTVSGKTCQKWTEQTRQWHAHLPSVFGSTSGLGDHNYCRNPDGELKAWCYTSDSDWEYCDIGLPPCQCYNDLNDDMRYMLCKVYGKIDDLRAAIEG